MVEEAEKTAQTEQETLAKTAKWLASLVFILETSSVVAVSTLYGLLPGAILLLFAVHLFMLSVSVGKILMAVAQAEGRLAVVSEVSSDIVTVVSSLLQASKEMAMGGGAAPKSKLN